MIAMAAALGGAIVGGALGACLVWFIADVRTVIVRWRR